MSKLITCDVCEEEFEKKNQRGRPPKTCYTCKENNIKTKTTKKKEKETASENGFIPVPILKPVEKPEDFSKGEMVYVPASFAKNDISKRRFAKEYKITGIKGQNIEVIRHAKTYYVRHKSSVHFSRLMRKSGIEYLDIEPDNVIIEHERDDS